jgi:hypothetical protein
MRSGLLAVAVLFVSVLMMSPANAEGFKEGKWAMTMDTKMENMPPKMAKAMEQMKNLPPEALAAMQKVGIKNMQVEGGGMSVTVTQCLNKENPIPKHSPSSEVNKHCQESHDISGDTVNFKSNCNFKDIQVDSSGTMKYSGDSMEGHIKSHQVRDGQSMDSTIDVTGKYLGPCDK